MSLSRLHSHTDVTLSQLELHVDRSYPGSSNHSNRREMLTGLQMSLLIFHGAGSKQVKQLVYGCGMAGASEPRCRGVRVSTPFLLGEDGLPVSRSQGRRTRRGNLGETGLGPGATAPQRNGTAFSWAPHRERTKQTRGFQNSVSSLLFFLWF